jgi:hypothetical protein
MKTDIVEINKLFEEIRPFIEPTHDELSIWSDKYALFLEQSQQSKIIYRKAQLRLNEIIISLTAEEIVEIYQTSGILMQRHLSGKMLHDFHEIYIPVMIKAIQGGHKHTASNFLHFLANLMGKDVIHLVKEALTFEWLQEDAIYIAVDLELRELIPDILMIIKSKNEWIKTTAMDAIQKLNN